MERNQARVSQSARSNATRPRGATRATLEARRGRDRRRRRAQALRRAGRVLLAELIDPTAGVDDFLLAGIKRMAVGADLDLKVLTDGRAGLEHVPAGAGHVDFLIFGMDAGFHVETSTARVRQNRWVLESFSRKRTAMPWARRNGAAYLSRKRRASTSVSPRIPPRLPRPAAPTLSTKSVDKSVDGSPSCDFTGMKFDINVNLVKK